MGFKEDIKKLHSQIDSLSIDEIKAIVDPYQRGIKIVSPVIAANSFFYRGRFFNTGFKKTDPIKISDLSYRKTGVPAGRANRENSPVFYCSDVKEIVFYELNVSEGAEFILSNWQNTATLIVSNIGYTESVFKGMGSTRICPKWGKREDGIDTFSLDLLSEEEMAAKLKKISDSDPHFEIRAFYNNEFMREDKSFYKLTTAIAEQHLGEIQDSALRFGGIIYPTVRMAANGDNVAILPWYVDRHLVFKGASHIKVTARKGNEISFSEVDYATAFDADGNLIWKGYPLHGNILPGHYTAKDTVGTDEFGFYERVYDGKKVRWEIYDENGTICS